MKDTNLRDEAINLVNETKWANLIISIYFAKNETTLST